MINLTLLYDSIRWEEKSLFNAAKKLDINMNMLDCKDLSIDLESNDTLGTVLQRCVSYYRNIHSTAALEGIGTRTINSLNTGIFAGNKLYTHMLLRKFNVPTPRATVSFSKDSALQVLKNDGYPKIIKPTVGSWGRMVSKINDLDSAMGILEGRESMYPIYQIHYMEEFVKRPPRDIRAIVVGDRVVAAIYRNSGSGWKTNMALGGVAEPCKVNDEMQEICIRAKDAVEGEIVGVDLMESDGGLVVHEINNTTEFKNTVRVCDVDIPTQIIQYVLDITRR